MLKKICFGSLLAALAFSPLLCANTVRYRELPPNYKGGPPPVPRVNSQPTTQSKRAEHQKKRLERRNKKQLRQQQNMPVTSSSTPSRQVQPPVPQPGVQPNKSHTPPAGVHSHTKHTPPARGHHTPPPGVQPGKAPSHPSGVRSMPPASVRHTPPAFKQPRPIGFMPKPAPRFQPKAPAPRVPTVRHPGVKHPAPFHRPVVKHPALPHPPVPPHPGKLLPPPLRVAAVPLHRTTVIYSSAPRPVAAVIVPAVVAAAPVAAVPVTAVSSTTPAVLPSAAAVPSAPVIPDYDYGWYQNVWVPHYQGWYWFNDTWNWGGTGKAPASQPAWVPDPDRPVPPPRYQAVPLS